MERVRAERSGLQWAPTPGFADKVRLKRVWLSCASAQFDGEKTQGWRLPLSSTIDYLAV